MAAGSGHRNSRSPRLKSPRPSSITQLFRLRRMQIEIDRIIMKSSRRRVQESERERERERGRGRRRVFAHKCQNLWRCLLCLLLDKSGIENRFLVLFSFCCSSCCCCFSFLVFGQKGQRSGSSWNGKLASSELPAFNDFLSLCINHGITHNAALSKAELPMRYVCASVYVCVSEG